MWLDGVLKCLHCNHSDTNSLNDLTLSEKTKSAVNAEKVALTSSLLALKTVLPMKPSYSLLINSREQQLKYSLDDIGTFRGP